MRVLSWDVGLRTLSYCVVAQNGDSGNWTIEQWDTIDVQMDTDTTVSTGARATGGKTTATRKKMTAVSVEYASQLVMDTLHRRAHQFDGVDAIIVEQQPAGGHNRHSNVRMKVVSHVIQCYFYTRGIMQATAVSPVITFVSPASKLVEMERPPRKKKTADEACAEDDDPDDFDQPAEKPTRQYTSNKKFAIMKTQELLGSVFEAQKDMGTFFNSSNVGKKDDLADSFLLGYYYVLKKTTPKKQAKRKPAAAAVEPGVDADQDDQPIKKRRTKKTKVD